MKFVTKNEITEAFIQVGARQCDTLMLHSDIARIGLVEGADSRDDTLATYVSAIRDAIGPDGTLVVLTASESFARHNTPFEYETTPSEQGALSEYVRNHPDAVRSLHPLFSVTALGRRADELCHDLAQTGYGYDSPFDRLHRMNALIACLGVDLLAMSFVHYIEQRFGVPYGYTKEWPGDISKDGSPVSRRFFAFVRHLNAGAEYDFTRFQDLLLQRGLAHAADLGYGHVHSVLAEDAFSVGVEMLKRDPFFFLQAPPTDEPWRK